MRQFGSFERLPERVRHYLEAKHPKDLFLRVLTRWQEDYDDASEKELLKKDLVRRAMTHLGAARQGLSEPEWLDLLGDDGNPLPRALWTPLFLALEPHLSRRAGLTRPDIHDSAVVSQDNFQARQSKPGDGDPETTTQPGHDGEPFSIADLSKRSPKCSPLSLEKEPMQHAGVSHPVRR